MISGKTTLIAHIGYPTEAFKAPLIYNPWFEMIPAYLEFFGFGTATPEELRAVAKVAY